MLSTLLHLFYVPVCVFLILVVLLQTGKRADLAGAFGGGGSQTAFGARGAATLLAKVTTGSAVAFMVLALALAILSSRQGDGGTVLDSVPITGDTPAPIEAPIDPGDAPATSEPDTPAQDAGPTPSESESDASDPATDDIEGDGTP